MGKGDNALPKPVTAPQIMVAHKHPKLTKPNKSKQIKNINIERQTNVKIDGQTDKQIDLKRRKTCCLNSFKPVSCLCLSQAW